MRKPLLLFFSFVFLLINANAQLFPPIKYPQNFFRSPLQIPLQLSGNFGELRTNHFHMGLDIRTAQRENMPVVAAAEGYVSRVKIEQYGYGRAIYITHPNGYTTLYAHLNDFYPELNEHIKAIQYRDEQWEQDVVLTPGLFTVKKGQFIANSGNTGGSAGPHLHFEIRETYTEKNLNPYPFNFNIPDHVRPYIYRLFMYDRRFSTYQMQATAIPIKGANGNYTSISNVVTVNTPRLSFGISAEDKTNSSFKFGIYQAEIYVDDQLQNAFRMDDFSYTTSRYINGAMDYSAKAKNGTLIQHLSQLPGNLSPIFLKKAGDGVITLNDSEVHDVLIKVQDAAGNFTNLKFKIRYNSAAVKEVSFSANTMPMLPGKASEYKSDNLQVSFSDKALYDTVPFMHSSQPSGNGLVVSQVHEVHNYTVPVHDYYTVLIKAEKPIPTNLKNKVLMQLTSNRRKVALKGVWKNDWMEGQFRELGTIQLAIDTMAPRLIPKGWSNGANLKNSSSITFVADDEESDLKSFRAELDGKWLMFSRKSDYFIHKFDERTKPGSHLLKVTIEDEVGNITEKIYSFTR